MMTQPENQNGTPAESPWAFSQSELAAGLRRYSGDPTLTVLSVHDREITQRLPAVGKLRGLEVKAQGRSGEQTFDLVLKQTRGSTRAGAAGAGLREVSVYLNFKEHLPVRMPTMIAAHPKGEWLVMVHLPPGRRPEKWGAADYLLAADQLAVLHDRFWGLSEDLAVYSWLEKPLDSDRDLYVQAAQADAQTLAEKPSGLLKQQTVIPAMTEKIVAEIETITDTLRASPFTLLHGDYWAGNIHIHPNSGITVFDWEDASVGPAVLDLLGFIQGSSWHFSPLPLPAEEIITHYRRGLSQAGAHTYNDEDWARLWDHAVMWTFVTGWANRLARSPDAMLSPHLTALEEMLFTPLREAVERQLS